ncbi:MAG: hypothetical protein HQ582_17745, partial [Planctomycetes bacterium]|nr:hypothetical protein [Planctomycetota bacterium]
ADTPEEEIALADGWWRLSEQATGQEQKQLQIVAAAHYKHVLPDLTGLTKAKAQKRLAEVTSPVPDIQEIFAASSPAQHYGDKKILLILAKPTELEAGDVYALRAVLARRSLARAGAPLVGGAGCPAEDG